MKFIVSLAFVSVVLLCLSVPLSYAQEAWPTKEQMRQMLPQLDRAISANPGDSRSLTARATIYREFGEYEKALADLDRAVALEPGKKEILTVRCVLYLKLKRYSDALSDADTAVKTAPDAMTITNRGAVYLVSNRLNEAIQDFTRATQLDSRNVNAWTGLGECAYRLKSYDKAIGYCNQALRLEPKLIEPLYFRGKSYEAQGKKDLANADLKKAQAAGYKPGELTVLHQK